ncbi:ATP-binding cassette domain-containing protein [Actinomadura sp. KC216]|uniref:ABC transporter ATP-binding protein n=1 Tax=Actinomadura sp. KC216 TaxID=2530370 RepID=UPI001404D3A8|nr:ATP-binding cassette domain-containing protein [Actinomadura sp. KC216]
MTELRLRSLTVTYGSVIATHAVDLTVPSGSLLAVVGPNGAGKSSLVEAVAGRARYRGDIALDGRSIDRLGTAARTRSGVGVVPQERELFHELNVHENLVVGCAGLGRAATRGALERSYEAFPILAKLRDRRAGHLSGGERQVLAIARVLCRRPRVMLLDEPSVGLSPSMREQIVGNLVRTCREMRVTAVITEQFVEMVLGNVDALVVLVNGRVEWRGAGARSDWPVIKQRYLGTGTASADAAVGSDRLGGRLAGSDADRPARAERNRKGGR